LVISVHLQRAGAFSPVLARFQCIRVAFSGDDQLRSQTSDLLLLGGCRDTRNEDLRAHAELASRQSNGDAVITSRSGYDTGRWQLAHQQVCEGAARLEGAAVLQQLELQSQHARRQPE